MICISKTKAGAEILTDYCAGTLDPARTAEFETHLNHCEECRKQADAQRSLWRALDTWTPVEVSPDFDANVYARIAAEGAEPWWRRMFLPKGGRSLWKPLLPLAAVGAILSMALLVRTSNRSAAPSHAAPQARAEQRTDSNRAVDQQDLNQVEQALDDMNLLTPVGQTSSSPL